MPCAIQLVLCRSNVHHSRERAVNTSIPCMSLYYGQTNLRAKIPMIHERRKEAQNRTSQGLASIFFASFTGPPCTLLNQIIPGKRRTHCNRKTRVFRADNIRKNKSTKSADCSSANLLVISLNIGKDSSAASRIFYATSSRHFGTLSGEPALFANNLIENQWDQSKRKQFSSEKSQQCSIVTRSVWLRRFHAGSFWCLGTFYILC